MDTATPDRTATAARDVLVSGVADLRDRPLADLVRARSNHLASRPTGADTGVAGEFNSSV